MSDVKWIKVRTDIFNDEKFDAIKTLPDKNDIQLVWIKLLCLAGQCNESGLLMLTTEIPYTDEMMAKRFDMDVGVVQRALSVFQSLGMIDVEVRVEGSGRLCLSGEIGDLTDTVAEQPAVQGVHNTKFCFIGAYRNKGAANYQGDRVQRVLRSRSQDALTDTYKRRSINCSEVLIKSFNLLADEVDQLITILRGQCSTGHRLLLST